MKKMIMNQKISKKLSYAFILVTLLGVINGLLGVFFIYTTVTNEKTLYEKNTQAQIDISAAQSKFYDIEIALKKIVINTNTTRSTYFTIIEENFAYLDDFIVKSEAAVAKSKEAQEQEYIDSLKESLSKYKEIVGSITNTAKSVTSSSIILQMVDTSDQYCGYSEKAFIALSDYYVAQSKKMLSSDYRSANIAIVILAAIVVASVVLALMLSRTISKMIADPMVTFAKFAQMLAVGDVNIEWTEEEKNLSQRKDEIGILAASFNKVIESTVTQGEEARCIADGDLTTWVTVRSDNDTVGNGLLEIASKLRGMVKSIKETTNRLALNAGSVSDSSMSLSQGATEQASAIEELTASIEEIANQTGANTQNANTANELAKYVKLGAEKGNEHMSDLQKAMEDINTSSNNIKKIIKVIDDIAFQTNILALNAAVEAARAGQHGKGFAVVAEEVRTLAGKSAQAAQETTDLIEGSIRNVEIGANLTNGTAAAFKKMSGDVGKVANLLEEIATAASEQASAIDQVNQGIAQVSQVVQNNAAISEESAAASIELTSQAQKLKEYIAMFTINKAGKPAAEHKAEAASETPKPAAPKPAAAETAKPAPAEDEAPEETPAPEEVPEAESETGETAAPAPASAPAPAPAPAAPKAKPVIDLGDADFGKY